MNKNCLVTKLKATVDNADLKFFDAIELRTSTTSTSGTFVSSGKIITGGIGLIVKVLSENATIYKNGANIGTEHQITGTEGTLKYNRILEDGKPIRILLKGLDSITNLTSDTGTVFTTYFDELSYIAPNIQPYNGAISLIKPPADSGIVGNGNWIKYISDKEPITNIYSNTATEGGYIDVELSSFSGFVNLVALPLSKINFMGDLAGISGLIKLTRLPFGNKTKIYGDISNIKDLALLKTIELNGCANVNGDIASFSRMTDIATLRINGTKVNGSIESLVSGLIDSRTSSGLTAASSFELYSNDLVTFEGDTIGNSVHKTVSWDDSGNITLT